MTKRIIHFGTLVIFGFLSACDHPSAIAEDQLAFLEDQRRPLLIQEVSRRLGATEFGRDGPYYEYAVRGTTKTVEFWMYPPPSLSADLQPGAEIPVEIAIVVETLNGNKASSRVIWPKNLGQTAIETLWKEIWDHSK